MDDQIKLNSYRIEVSEVDAALAPLPGGLMARRSGWSGSSSWRMRWMRRP